MRLHQVSRLVDDTSLVGYKAIVFSIVGCLISLTMFTHRRTYIVKQGRQNKRLKGHLLEQVAHLSRFGEPGPYRRGRSQRQTVKSGICVI